MQPGTLVFSHANSYPAACYRLLFEAWRAAGWTVHALPKFGHDARFPVSSNWPHLVRQLESFIDDEVQPKAPVALVGHSLGGLISLMLAARRPEWAACVVQLDSPFISGWRRELVRFGKLSGLAWRVPPASIAKQRRDHWPDTAAVAGHFGAKAMFKAWDPRVLADYLACGFEPDALRGGVRLAFHREVEMRIYAGLPHNLPQLARRLKAPLGFLAGKQSFEMRQGGVQATRRFVGAQHFREIEGSHLFPFEKPEASAALVLDLLQDLG
jgi:pimeloyl-ACP methyl ester carboxylesterase